MKWSELQIPIATLIVCISTVAGATWWTATNVVFAEDFEKSLKKLYVEESIRNDRLWIEVLEQKKEKAVTEIERQKLDRQLRITEESLIRNMQMDIE
jgi:hypothetical protein